MNKQIVSVVITTKNEEEVIGRLIESINKQTYPNFEIILVDNHSTDKTLQIAKKFKIKVFEHGPERSAQRNFGSKVSKGQYLLFLDADMELSKEVLSDSIKLISQDKRVGAMVIPEKSIANNFWEKVKSYERSFYNEEGDEITDAARFFNRKVFEKAGGYDESLTGPEDWDLTDTIKKLNYKIGRISSPIYHYERINSPLVLARKKFYYALASYKYLSKQRRGKFGPKTIYFLRPVFYKNWRKLVSHPILSTALFFLLSLELLAGGLGYLVGRMSKR